MKKDRDIEIVKIGGKIMKDKQQLDNLLKDFASLEGNKILVHGGGEQVSELARRLGVKTNMVEGRRITDHENLEIAIMVYAGLLNKKLVSKLQSIHVNALGMTGADLNSISATRRKHETIDFGEVGDISVNDINVEGILDLVKNGITPVFCSITHDNRGNLFNTNADTIASTMAIALTAHFNVHLTFCFEYKGVLQDVADPDSWIGKLTYKDYQLMLKNGTVSNGMLPKLENGFEVLRNKVSSVKIKNAQYLKSAEGTRLYLGEFKHEYETGK